MGAQSFKSEGDYHVGALHLHHSQSSARRVGGAGRAQGEGGKAATIQNSVAKISAY